MGLVSNRHSGLGQSAAPSPPSGLANYEFTSSGATTFGFALPAGASTGNLKVGSLATQVDIKNQWDDDSIRFAIVSAEIPSSGSYTITTNTAAVGTFTPTWPTITFELVIAGDTWVASAGSFSASNLWLDGPVCREKRVQVFPTHSATPHALIEVIFDVRSYVSGATHIDVVVQNVIDATAMDKVAVTSMALKVNGSSVWTTTAFTLFAATRVRVPYGYWSTGSEAEIVPDFGPLWDSKAIPRIKNTVDDTASIWVATDANYTGLYGGAQPGGLAWAFGNMTPDQSAGGGRPEISVLPDWEAVYLIHKSQNNRQVVIRNADLSAAWSLHLTKPDGSFIDLDTSGYPADWWWYNGAAVGHRPLAPKIDVYGYPPFRGFNQGHIESVAAPSPCAVNMEHVPTPWFLAYLLTGDRFYVDQSRFWATGVILTKAPGYVEDDPVNFPGYYRFRNGAGGNERILDDSGVTREFAWPMLLVGNASWMTPDADTAWQTYFVDTIQNNLGHWDAYYDQFVAHSYGGAMGAMGGFENPGGWSTTRSAVATSRYTSLWRMTFTLYALDWITRQGLWTISADVQASLNRLCSWMVKMNVQNTDWVDDAAANWAKSWGYYPSFNTMSGGVFTHWFDTWAEMKKYNETYAFQDDPLDWSSGTNYGGASNAYGALVKYSGTYYQAIANSGPGLGGAQLPTNATYWIPRYTSDVGSNVGSLNLGWYDPGFTVTPYRIVLPVTYNIALRRAITDADDALDRLNALTSQATIMDGAAGYNIYFDD